MSGVVIVEQRIGIPAGSLTVYTTEIWTGTTTIRVLDAQGNKGQAYYAEVHSWKGSNGQTFLAGYFPTLPPGNYVVAKPGTSDYQEKRVTVFPGSQANVDYR